MLKFLKRYSILFLPFVLATCTLLEHLPYHIQGLPYPDFPAFERKFIKNEPVKFAANDLKWGIADSDSMNWFDANKHCKSLNKRLPTKKELLDLSQKRKELYRKFKNKNPHRIIKACRRGIYCYYWSSTPYEDNKNEAWGVDVGNGDSYTSLKNFYDGYVICVQ